MSGINIIHSITIRHHIAFKTPLLTEDIIEQKGTAAAGQTTEAVVGAHDRISATFPHGHFKMREITAAKVRKINDCIKDVALWFGAAVNGIMLSRGNYLKIFRIITLQPADKAHCHRACQIGILAISFHAPPPAWITEKIDIG